MTTLLLVMSAISSAPHSDAEESVYASDDVLHLTIHGPLAKLARSAKDADDVPGLLELEDGTKIEMTFTKFGVSRLHECGVPSLAITLEPDLIRGTPFEGQRRLWLVTPCFHHSNYDKYTLLEYLIYRSYALVADPALHSRLVSLRYRDTQRRSNDRREYAFILEDIGLSAARSGATWSNIPAQNITAFDPAQLATMVLFQYMIGNTDWSALAGPPGKPCCHNVAIFSPHDATVDVAVPHDFDQAGLVNAPYAVPNPIMKIDNVTERAYRGFCLHNDELPAVIEVFNNGRPAIDELFQLEDLPYPDARARALRYIGDFYDTINDPKKLKKKLLRNCR